MPADGAIRLAAGRGTTAAVARRPTFTRQLHTTAGDAVPATRIAIGPIRAATQPTGRAAESAITTALPATVALAGTHAIRVAPSQIASRIQATHTMFLQSRASACHRLIGSTTNPEGITFFPWQRL